MTLDPPNGPTTEADGDPSPGNSEAPPVKQPWWIPPVLGRVPAEFNQHHLRLLGLVALTLLFESYDAATLSAAIKHIREDFGFEQSQMPTVVSVVRLGAIPALIFILPFADRIGRRRLFLTSVVGMAIATFFTAFSANITQFIALQMIARVFLITGAASTFVIVSEELPSSARGWGIGVLGALAAVGYGLSAGLFSAIEVLPYGWRFLYAVGVVPLFLFPMLRAEVGETRRYRDLRSRAGGQDTMGVLLKGWWKPYAGLIAAWPLRALGLVAVAIMSAGAHAPGLVLLADYVQTDRGWTPGQYGAMVIVGGAFGIIGNTTAGRMADVLGRRTVGVALLVAYPVIALALYRGSGWVIPLMWVPLVFTLTGASTILRAVATELFPTGMRATSTGLLMLCETLGAATGLVLVTVLTPEGESTANVISLLGFFSAGAALVMLGFPETARLELEEISEGGHGGS